MPTRVVALSQEEADYILEQLATTIQRGRDGQRPGSHLLKRIRRSRAILMCALEESQKDEAAPEKLLVHTGEQKKKGNWFRTIIAKLG